MAVIKANKQFICDICGRKIGGWLYKNHFYKVAWYDINTKRRNKLDVCFDCFDVIRENCMDAIKEGEE